MCFHPTKRPGAITTILVLAITGIVISAFVSLSVVATGQITQVRDNEGAEQTFFAAESGLNIGLERVRGDSLATIPPFVMNQANVTVEIVPDQTNPYGRTITSHAVHANGQERTLQIKVNTSTFALALNHAVHAGSDGIIFESGSTIYGDAHSNGNVVPSNNEQGLVLPVPDDLSTTQNESLQYPGNLTVSGDHHIVSQLIISGNVWAHTLKGSNNNKRLSAKSTKFQEIGPNPDEHVYANGTQCETNVDNGACDANSGFAQDQQLPIGTTEITNWANEVITVAGAGTTLSGDQNIVGPVTWTGPTKVDGNITFGKDASLKVTGPLWVTKNVTVNKNGNDPNAGQITFGSNALIEGNLTMLQNTKMNLAASLGEDDGVVIVGDPGAPSTVEGKILVENGVTVQGSGFTKSSLTLISTNTSLDKTNPAIGASNTATGVIYYAKDGIARVYTGGNLNAVFGKQIYLDAGAKVTFKPLLHFFSIPDPDPDPISVLGPWKDL